MMHTFILYCHNILGRLSVKENGINNKILFITNSDVRRISTRNKNKFHIEYKKLSCYTERSPLLDKFPQHIKKLRNETNIFKN